MFDHQRRINSASLRFGFISRSVILRMFAFLSAGMVIATQVHAAEVVDLQLRWHHQFQFAGYYAALEKGFYKEEGLDVASTPVTRRINRFLKCWLVTPNMRKGIVMSCINAC